MERIYMSRHVQTINNNKGTVQEATSSRTTFQGVLDSKTIALENSNNGGKHKMLMTRDFYHEKVYQERRFKDFTDFREKQEELENIIRGQFPSENLDLKLIGSAATGTMRLGEGDFDYFIGFDKPPETREFERRMLESGIDFHDVNNEKDYNYVKLSGIYKDYKFVMVPTTKPGEILTNYTHDAYYHPELINNNKSSNHSKNSILAKEFFEKVGVYKKVKGIGCELLTLYYEDFDTMLQELQRADSIRINYSDNNKKLDGKLVIDYPYIGGRSLTRKVTDEDWNKIKLEAGKALREDEYLL